MHTHLHTFCFTCILAAPNTTSSHCDSARGDSLKIILIWSAQENKEENSVSEMTESYNFGLDTITCHAWNNDRTGLFVWIWMRLLFDLFSLAVSHCYRIVVLNICLVYFTIISEVAVCPKSSAVHVYKRSGSQWKPGDVLQAHDMSVMCLDWAPKTNRIVTCAADKTAYVWSLGEDGKWMPAWVVLRTNRAAVCVKWAPQGDLR